MIDLWYNRLCKSRKIDKTEFSFSNIEPILKPVHSQKHFQNRPDKSNVLAL